MVVTSADVIWHDLECDSYRTDLPLWRELAERHGGPILDVGAGTGRVALDLAHGDHCVTALDLDPDLLGTLRGRAGEEPVETVCADARSSERMAFLRCALAHLRPGGLLACAIVTELDSFDVADGSPGPTPETSQVGETLYISQATSVRVLPERIVIERSRRIVSSDARNPSDEGTTDTPAVERNIIELARISAFELECEASEVGFHSEPALVIGPTEEHVGSVVVMLRA